MRVLVITQGKWGHRIADHLRETAPSEWQIVSWQGPTTLPAVLDDPETYLPEALPQADLLLVLTESAGMTDLVPELAQLCGAEAVIVPVDRRSWAPPGLVRQVERRLDIMGLGSVFPMPFCSLAPRKTLHPLVVEFARRYGRPELACEVENGSLSLCEVGRETPCGNTRYIAARLGGVSVGKAAQQAGLLHHYYPCWGGMGGDPVQGTHTLLHIAATMVQKSVERALKKGECI